MGTTTNPVSDKVSLNLSIFDLFGDDDDDHKQRLDEWNMTYHFDQLHRSMAEEEEPLREEQVRSTTGLCRALILDLQEEQQVLSQRLSQLSTASDFEIEPADDGKRRRAPTTTVSSNVNVKKVRIDTDDPPGQERIPTYLSIQHLICQNIDIPSHLSIEDLQQLAFCMHQLGVLPIEEELWTGYRQCGTGLWREQSILCHRQYWPHHVKSLVSTQTNDSDEQQACETIVQQRLQEIHNQMVGYQTEYQDKQRTLGAVTPALEEILRKLVHENAIVPLRMKVDMALAVLRCEDEDHWLQCQYQAEGPTDYQVRTTSSPSSIFILFIP